MPFLAPSLVALRDEINARWPNRDKSSDGWIGDVAHQIRASDHNPDERGMVHALDIDEDLDGNRTDSGDELSFMAEHWRSTRDHRIKYVIYGGRIYSGIGGPSPWVWRTYTGVNAHLKHLHVSIRYTFTAEHDTSVWLPGILIPTPPLIEEVDDMYMLRHPGTGNIYAIHAFGAVHLDGTNDVQAFLAAGFRQVNGVDGPTVDAIINAAGTLTRTEWAVRHIEAATIPAG